MRKYLFLVFSISMIVLTAAENHTLAQKTKIRRIVTGKPLIVTVQASTPPPKNLSPEQQRRYDAFIKAWQTLNDYYFDRTFSGLNWDEIKKEFQPRVLAAKTDNEVHELLREMIGRLHRSHLTIISPEVFKAIETAKAASKKKEREIREKIDAGQIPTEEDAEEEINLEFEANSKYGIGADLRLVNNEFVISRVEKNSAAEYRGLKTGFVITKINSVSLKDLLFKIQIYSPNEKNVLKTVPLQVMNYFLNGEKDSEVEIEYLDAQDQLKTVKIRRELLKGETISMGKNYPEQYLRFEKTSLTDETGYIKFNLFALPVITDVCSAISDFKNKKAIIIDLRENLGGILGTMIGLGGMLTDKELDLGTSFYKTGSENLTALSKVKNYKGKIVVLVDNMTVSAAEIFSAALQENNRAVVVGEKTAGEALPSVSISLPTGAVMTYPIANYKTHKGNLIEGNGVQPDFTAEIDRKSLLENKDNQLETALRLIRENKVAGPGAQAPIKSADEGIGSGMPPPPPPPPPARAPASGVADRPGITGTAAKPKIQPAADVKDEKSQEVIAAFFKVIGGEENLQKINTYHIKGETQISVRGSEADAEYDVYLQKPDQYAESIKTQVIGEVRNIYKGKTNSLQSDYGLNYDIPNDYDISEIEVLSPIYNLLDKNFFKSFKYLGIFDKNGRKNHVIQAVTKRGAVIGLAFDVETKRLTSYVGNYQVINLSDYREVESFSLPFSIEQEHIMNVKVTSYEINKPVDPSNFEKKENCFDRPD